MYIYFLYIIHIYILYINIIHIFICVVLLNYCISQKKCPLKLHNLLYIFICINTLCQNINVQHPVLYLKVFLPYEWTSVFYYNMHTIGVFPSGISSSRHNIKLTLYQQYPVLKNYIRWRY